MLLNLNEILSMSVAATDGDGGYFHDCYFDDRYWIVRYWVIDTGIWLAGRKTLITPQAVSEIDWETDEVVVSLSKAQIEDSPGIEIDLPVSRQKEEALLARYGRAVYGKNSAGAETLPRADPKNAPAEVIRTGNADDPNMRSVRELIGYHVSACDGDTGYVDDFILDIGESAIRYVVVDAHNWLPARKVLISPSWANEIDWEGRKLDLSMSRSDIRRSPEYDPTMPISRDFEKALHDHFARPPYWF